VIDEAFVVEMVPLAAARPEHAGRLRRYLGAITVFVLPRSGRAVFFQRNIARLCHNMRERSGDGMFSFSPTQVTSRLAL